jgi:aminopeptidase
MVKKQNYHPSQKILERYADVLVNFALGGGKGIKKNDVVHLIVYEYAKPFYRELYKAILKAGGHVIADYRPDSGDRFPLHKEFYLYAENDQLTFFPEKYLRGVVEQVDHSIFILSDTDKHALKGVDPKKIMTRNNAFKPYMDWRRDKENQGKYTWTLALYGTPAMAKEAGLSEKVYWRQIIDACFLNNVNPVKKWKEVHSKVETLKDKLNKLPIHKLHILGPDADLWILLGEKRKWAGGSGRNIPSFEIFTSPDWRGTEGWIRFNQPLYRYGQLIKSAELWFKNGRVVKAKAKTNEKTFKEMIASKNADKIGEYSLTDRRFSRITKFMAETLFDENIGGKEGNTHLALGNSYHDCFAGDPSKMSSKDWEDLGFNDSPVHTDIISTAPRTVTAFMRDGSNKVIYKNGEFKI